MRKKTTLFAVLAVLWGLFIFFHSLQNGEVSTQLSDGVVNHLSGWMDWHTLTILVRKSAHIGEYLLLSVFCCLSFYYGGGLRFRNLGNLLFPSLLWAVADEFIQTFVEGRTGLVRDVLIDFSGIAAGMLLVFLGTFLWNRRKKKQVSRNKHRLNITD